MPEAKAFLRRIPKVDLLLADPGLAELRAGLSREALVGLIRVVLEELREGFLTGRLDATQLAAPAIVARVAARGADWLRPPLRRVINATGILIHTNLGRAPLAASAQAAIAQVCGGYSNLELDLATGRRTSRLSRVSDLLRQLTGAEDALAVNNNAAAVFLTLHGLAVGREVLVSRGELVEIGGSFRLPDIMSASGAILREIGTTNRTRRADYQDAITERTALILKVHPSNFVIQGFTESVATADLAALAHAHGLPLLEDLGSGALAQHPREHLRAEPRVQSALQDGADLVCFSGDKLLGGPQAGILLGRREPIGALRTHPLARVLRLDKLHLAALEATLLEYLRGAAGLAEIPLYRMLHRDAAELREIAEGICEEIRTRVSEAWRVRAIETRAALGGGSLPGETLASAGIEISRQGVSLEELAARLRTGEPALIGRLDRERLILDLRTVTEEDWMGLAASLIARLTGDADGPPGQGG